MKVATVDGRWFALRAECDADTAFLDAIDLAGNQLHVVRLLRTEGRNSTAILSADRSDPRARRTEASRQIAGALSQLVGLLPGDSPLHVYSRAASSDPESAAELAERIDTLQIAMGAGRPAVHAGEVRRGAPVPGAYGVTITTAGPRAWRAA